MSGPVASASASGSATATARAEAIPLRAEFGRKAFHFATAIVPIAWGLGWVATPLLRAVLAAAVAVALLVELARRFPGPRRWFMALFGTMLRAHEHRAITGATWMALAMLGAVLLLPARAALVALWAAVFGDGLATIVGRLAVREGAQKTWWGSVACVVATAAGALWLAQATVVQALLVGGAAAAAERPRLALDDNLRVTMAAGLAAWVLLAP